MLLVKIKDASQSYKRTFGVTRVKFECTNSHISKANALKNWATEAVSTSSNCNSGSINTSGISSTCCNETAYYLHKQHVVQHKMDIYVEYTSV